MSGSHFNIFRSLTSLTPRMVGLLADGLALFGIGTHKFVIELAGSSTCRGVMGKKVPFERGGTNHETAERLLNHKTRKVEPKRSRASALHALAFRKRWQVPSLRAVRKMGGEWGGDGRPWGAESAVHSRFIRSARPEVGPAFIFPCWSRPRFTPLPCPRSAR
jgi:hypothetical protein